ncbi:MAG: hypothetical protein ABSG90_01005 [Dehalococcoidia bacterium]|jgi:hypothetical protein
MSSITELGEIVAALPPQTQQVFNHIFSVNITRGILKPPSPMVPWIEERFGSLDKVIGQKVVRVTNLVTAESSIFNPLRSLRPHDFSQATADEPPNLPLPDDDPFSMPLDSTPEDPFGRVKGKYCITASNVAKFEQYHCVLIFKNHEPLSFDRGEVADYIETGWKWAQKAHAYDPLAQYCLFLWNCTNRAGASIKHGHAQVVVGSGSHYGRVEQLCTAVEGYSHRYGRNYFDDLFMVHEALGLAWKAKASRTIVYLSALKQKEVMVLGTALDDSFTGSIYNVLSCFRDRLQVKAFNLGIVFPPLGDVSGWEGFPLIARMVDRGDTGDLSSDIGAMEFYGANVVNSDPFEVARALRECFKG